MKKTNYLFTILLAIVIFASQSCKKEEGLTNKDSHVNKSSLRLSTEMTNEEMEDDINFFIDMLNSPEGQNPMNYEEAFEYIEATLNYQYVNYDYSKCANVETFTSSFDFSTDANGMMEMTSIKLAYDSILSNWRAKYYSVENSNKTPIVFDIYEVSPTRVNFRMVVGYGGLDLSYWLHPTPPSSGVYFIQAAQNYSNGMAAQINNQMISRIPAGFTRAYYVQLGGQYISNNDALNYPSGSADISLPGNNGYTDYLFFFSSSLPPYQNFHLYLNVPPQLNEYGFYATQLGQYVTDYAANNGGNRVSLCDVYPFYEKDQNNNFTKASHGVNFYYGKEYYTLTNVSAL